MDGAKPEGKSATQRSCREIIEDRAKIAKQRSVTRLLFRQPFHPTQVGAFQTCSRIKEAGVTEISPAY